MVHPIDKVHSEFTERVLVPAMTTVSDERMDMLLDLGFWKSIDPVQERVMPKTMRLPFRKPVMKRVTLRVVETP